MKTIKKWPSKIFEDVRSHLSIYTLLFVILALAFFVRVYRVDQILGFYYDQGRDAKVIWELFHNGKFFLIGPTTGIEGIFRGPLYYYLIAPFYLLGNGNPIWPSVFLSFTTVIAIVFIYYLGAKIVDRTTGIIAAILASFSFNLVISSRWLSNPTPMLLLSIVLVWAMMKVVEGKKWAWPVIAFVSGLSLFHFGSSGEIFYFLALLIFIAWQRKNLPSKKTFLLSVASFMITVLPLAIFDLKHDGILRDNISKFLVGEKSFGPPTWRNIGDKVEFYYDVFTNKIFNARYEQERVFLGVIAFFFAFYLSRMLKNPGVKILLLLLGAPIVGLIFFQGNFGNIYDYYLTGYYLIFILLFAITLGFLWKNKLGKIFVLYFIYLFLMNNYNTLKFKLSDYCTGEISICYINQKQAVDWVYQDADDRIFNVDAYVPPVIPHAYDYLFLWWGTTRYGRVPKEEQIPLLYTLYEVDPPHPERLEAWLQRQEKIGKVEEEIRFGGITVQRRERLTSTMAK